MAKVIKKIFLLFVLITSLFKQLFISLGLFGLSCVKKHPKTAAISSGIVLAAICALMPSVFTSNSSQANTRLVSNFDNNTANIISQHKNMFATGSDTDDKAGKEAGKPKEGLTALDRINNTFAEIDGIAFQATHLSESTSVGRSEPFAPVVGPSDLETGSLGASGKALTPEEIAIQKAEERRNKIRETLNNNVTVKGIVVDTNNKRPMAVVEITKPDGNSEIKTVLPGENLYFADCLAKVTKISQDKVSLSSEDIKVDRFIPDFNDDTGKTSDSTSNNTVTPSDQGSNNLISPPMPKNTNKAATGTNKVGGSMGNAKQKIEEIDKLLDSI